MQTEFLISDPNKFISQQLQIHLSDLSYRQISQEVGTNPETVRRFMCGKSRISAEFIQQVCLQYKIDANQILRGKNTDVELNDLRSITTGALLQELAKRITLVEDTVVGQCIVSGKP